MKKLSFFIAMLLLLSSSLFAQVAINSTGDQPDSSAMLDVQSSSKGILIPKMTSSQRLAITRPASGLMVYQTDAPAGYYFNAGTGASPQWKMLQVNSGNDHSRLHSMTSPLDHSAGNWKLFYSSGSGVVNELGLGTSGQVLQSAGVSSVPFWITPYTGLTNFTESNYTYNARTGVRLLSTNAAANVDLVIQPKGTGGILAQQPDGTAAGGNNRGINAVDLQTARGAAHYVAGGGYSVVTGGYSNLAAGYHSNVGGGRYNRVGGNYSAIVGGRNDTVVPDYSILGGGYNNAIMAGGYSVLGGGYLDTVTGSYAFLGGGDRTKVTGYISALVGGQYTLVTGDRSFAGGGYANVVSGAYSALPGGRSNTAGGSYSTVSGGYGNGALGYGSAVGGGVSNSAQGTYTFAAGGGCVAHDFAESTFGHYPTIADGDSIAFAATDRLFAIGNGTGSSARSNALTILKNANTTMGGTLEINKNGTNTSYIFPSGRGTGGQFLKTDGAGNTIWTDLALLPAGTPGQTMRHDGTAWVASSILNNNGDNVGVGTATPAASAILDVSSSEKGFLPPRMTTTQINAIITPEEGLIVYNTSLHILVVYDGTGWKGTDGKFYIGLSYAGGIIFYIDGTGQHGLISATTDQSSGAQWGCFGATIGGTSTAIGTGQANTTAIVNGCATAGIAARICNDLVLNGFSDWFLPSKDELNQMYLNRILIGGFAGDYYWSSTEDYYSNAWFQYFSNGGQYSSSKGYADHVRAVRAF